MLASRWLAEVPIFAAATQGRTRREALEMIEEERYEQAMQEYLGRTPRRLKPEGQSYPSREDLHDR